MADTLDIVIRRARLRASPDRLTEIGIRNGHIAAIAARTTNHAQTEIDARGNLVTESFVNPHLHLCKVWTLPMMEQEALKAYQSDNMRAAASAIETKGSNSWDSCWELETTLRLPFFKLFGVFCVKKLLGTGLPRDS
jgi:cytosine/creatinine deaminase